MNYDPYQNPMWDREDDPADELYPDPLKTRRLLAYPPELYNVRDCQREGNIFKGAAVLDFDKLEAKRASGVTLDRKEWDAYRQHKWHRPPQDGPEGDELTGVTAEEVWCKMSAGISLLEQEREIQQKFPSAPRLRERMIALLMYAAQQSGVFTTQRIGNAPPSPSGRYMFWHSPFVSRFHTPEPRDTDPTPLGWVCGNTTGELWDPNEARQKYPGISAMNVHRRLHVDGVSVETQAQEIAEKYSCDQKEIKQRMSERLADFDACAGKVWGPNPPYWDPSRRTEDLRDMYNANRVVRSYPASKRAIDPYTGRVYRVETETRDEYLERMGISGDWWREPQ